MHILYFLFVKKVELLLPIVAFFSWNKKLKLFVEGRKDLFARIKLSDNPNRYWFHCASLGEFEQAKPVIELLKEKNPETSIVISFFSPSGYEQRKDYELAEYVFYLPLDTPANAEKLVALIKPKAVLFVKYEIWYFCLKSLFKHKIPVYLISANFRKEQGIFSIWGKWLFNLLPQYTQIFVQNKTTFELLKRKGLTNITMSGDTRYDRVIQNAENIKENEIIASFKGVAPLLILGSSWPAEEDILDRYLERILKDKLKPVENIKQHYKIIIAPHDISERHIKSIMEKFNLHEPFLYTGKQPYPNSNLMIMNTIGHLASAYYYADVAFVGGGFTGQLHNILEPLSFGVPVITGPVHTKFPEAQMAKNSGVLFETTDASSFNNNLNIIEQNRLNDKARLFIGNHSGATAMVLNAIV